MGRVSEGFESKISFGFGYRREPPVNYKTSLSASRIRYLLVFVKVFIFRRNKSPINTTKCVYMGTNSCCIVRPERVFEKSK